MLGVVAAGRWTLVLGSRKIFFVCNVVPQHKLRAAKRKHFLGD